MEGIETRNNNFVMLEPDASRGARPDLRGGSIRKYWFLPGQYYYQALKLELDPYDRSYILYNIGLIHTSNGKHGRALEYYYQALKRNPTLPQALNNIAVIYHYRAEQATEKYQSEVAKLLYDKAADYWNEAIRLAPTNYLEAQSWLKKR